MGTQEPLQLWGISSQGDFRVSFCITYTWTALSHYPSDLSVELVAQERWKGCVIQQAISSCRAIGQVIVDLNDISGPEKY